jgi:predicted DNA-binding transcriptional regulator AlpA
MNYTIRTNLLNVKEVAVLLKISALTVYKYISERKIKAIRFGGRYLVDKTSLNGLSKYKKAK